MQHECRAEHPRPVVVDRVERDPQWVVSCIQRMPVANSTSTPPTNSRIKTRSTALARFPTVRLLNNFGITDHSFASTSGSVISPNVTWVPWVTA